MIILFVYTRHAIEKMDGLGIEKKEVQITIIKGMKWKSEDKWHSQMGGLEVVFVKEENNLVIVTVYLAGRLK